VYCEREAAEVEAVDNSDGDGKRNERNRGRLEGDQQRLGVRRVGQRRREDGQQRRIVVVETVVVGDGVQVGAGPHRPGGAQETVEIAHAPAHERRAHLDRDRKRRQQQKEGGDAHALPRPQWHFRSAGGSPVLEIRRPASTTKTECGRDILVRVAHSSVPS
jgi:hypothetical protein